MALLKALGRTCRSHGPDRVSGGERPPWWLLVHGQQPAPRAAGLASGTATGALAASRTQGQSRQMATLRELSMRLKSVQNISKITKSMKMIAATKLTRAQRNMEVAREYGKASTKIFELSQTAELAEGKKLVVTVSSDRGLCGGVHSTVSKATKRLVADNPDLGLVILGDKAKGQLQRDLRAKIMLTFNQIGKSIPTFNEAAAIADAIRQHASSSYVSVAIVYNSFKSVIAFEPKIITAYSTDALRKGAKFSSYESSSGTLADFQNFTLANSLYWAMSEGHAAEMASKRTAMENATKNAGEMIQSMTMQYNRSRQAVITNELIDIITGASAL